ncbi:hypothetical protein BJ165DRAFT_1403730 [Panaeolus papilionaceus]|nr:hypothetical protein BJ165DRAFT_1403730 [Panaeolus papilionaceus]
MSKDTKASESKTSLLSSDSSTPLVSANAYSKSRTHTGRQKNYEAALGALQSRYGTGGGVPSPKPPGDASNKLTLPLHMQVGSSKQAETTNSSTTSHSSQLTPSTGSSKDHGPVQANTAPREEPKKSTFSRLFKELTEGRESFFAESHGRSESAEITLLGSDNIQWRIRLATTWLAQQTAAQLNDKFG